MGPVVPQPTSPKRQPDGVAWAVGAPLGEAVGVAEHPISPRRQVEAGDCAAAGAAWAITGAVGTARNRAIGTMARARAVEPERRRRQGQAVKPRLDVPLR